MSETQDTPIEFFNWHIHEQGQCRSILDEGGWCCQRPAGHDGPHAHNLRWLSGDPDEPVATPASPQGAEGEG